MVKTEPVISKKYIELVCTAGINARGEWRRLYPIPFRALEKDSQYRKYQWIEIDIRKNPSDQRIESYKPLNNNDIVAGEVVGTEQNWQKRKEILSNTPVYKKLSEIKSAAKDNKFSLCVFKPAEIGKLVIEKGDPDWGENTLREIKLHKQQSGLFSAFQRTTREIEKLPYKFSYHFRDVRGEDAQLMITDWEIGQLYRNCVKRHQGDIEKALADVRKKYEEDFLQKKNLSFFWGTTLRFHRIAPNPFLIVGIFYPPKRSQQPLL